MPYDVALPADGPGDEPDVRELIARAQRGDRAARDQLVAANLRLVHAIVARFAGAGREAEDLFQIGCIGLIKAVDRFDLRFPVRFSTYAVPLILGEIRRHLRDDGPLRVSRSLKLLAQQVARAQEDLQQSLGREPTLAEVAAAVGAPVERVVEALEGARAPASIQEAVYEQDGDAIVLGDQIAGGDPGDGAWLDRVALRQGLAQLDPRERQVILLRYFRDRTQVEVAQVLGVSQVQVSRIERRALEKIRRYLEGSAGGP